MKVNSTWQDEVAVSSQLGSLTVIDSEIVGLHKLLNAIGPKGLKQLIVIFNKDLDYDYDPVAGPDNSIIAELFQTDLSRFKNL